MHRIQPRSRGRRVASPRGHLTTPRKSWCGYSGGVADDMPPLFFAPCIPHGRAKTFYSTCAQEVTMSTKPEIIITTQDAERLEILLDSLSSVAFPAKAGLAEELDRAVRVDPRQVPRRW